MSRISDISKLHALMNEQRIETLENISNLLESWDLFNKTFLNRLSQWLDNFSQDNFNIAIKIVTNLDYYSEERLERTFSSRLDDLVRSDIDIHNGNCIFVTPDNIADSANRHAWLISKIAQISGKSFIQIRDFNPDVHGNKKIIFINDTHGTGDQFIRELWTPYKEMLSPSNISVVGIAVASTAFKNLTELGFSVFPSSCAANIKSTFTEDENNCLYEIGKKIHPKKPLGYGDCGLLVAYHFQCPNNSTPLLWLSQSREDGYPWKALFPYRSKPKQNTSHCEERIAPSIKHLATKHQAKKLDSLTQPSLQESLLIYSRKTNLVGRDNDLEQVLFHLGNPSFSPVAIVGPPGIGKTSLAIGIGLEMKVRNFVTNTFFISAKTGNLTKEIFLDGLAHYLGYSGIASEENIILKEKKLKEVLQNQTYLLIIDNAESILDCTSIWILLTSFSEVCRILITSRVDNIGILESVQLYRLCPLSSNDSLQMLSNELARLDMHFGFKNVKSRNEDPVTNLLRLIDGVPIVIKWVAGQIASNVPLNTICDKLSCSSGEMQDFLMKENWSNLTENSQRALLALAICDATIGYSILHNQAISDNNPDVTLNPLFTRKILEAERVSIESSIRISCHPLVRSFLSARLAEDPSKETEIRLALMQSLSDFILERSNLQLGRCEFDEIGHELPNILKLLLWDARSCVMKPELIMWTSILVKLADASSVYLWTRGFWTERVRVSLFVAEIAANAKQQITAGRHYVHAGIVRYWQGNLVEAKHYQNLAEKCLKQGNALDIAFANRLKGLIYNRSEPANALALMLSVFDAIKESNSNSIDIQAKIRLFADWPCAGKDGYRIGEIAVMQEIGIIYNNNENPEEAIGWLLKSLALAQNIGDIEGESISHSHLGRSYLLHGNLTKAIKHLYDGLSLSREVSRRSTEARCMLGLAEIKNQNAGGDFPLADSASDLALCAEKIFCQLGMNSEEMQAKQLLSGVTLSHVVLTQGEIIPSSKSQLIQEKIMKIRKKSLRDVPIEGAHGGSGGRRMYVDKGELNNIDWQAMTYGFLPAQSSFDWHKHENIEEVMLVLKGSGTVSDRDGTYPYQKGDLFIFPADVEHRIENGCTDENEFIFVRVSSRAQGDSF